MDYLILQPSQCMKGSISISGSKNSALPLISASLLARTEVVLENLPDVVDVKTFFSLLSMLGASIKRHDCHSASLDTNSLKSTKALYDIVRKMRASILVLGPLLGRYGHCEVSLPGGCAIGARPVDLHIKALQKMGADICIKGGYIVANAKHGLKGSVIDFDKITVTGTENIIMAAAMAKGRSKIINAAKEPEVIQLCEVLQLAGLEISGIGSDEIEIVGTQMEGLCFPKPIQVIPDRIEAGTYLCAGAITNSEITLDHTDPLHLCSVITKLEEIGFRITKNQHSMTIHPAQKMNPFSLLTSEYPGFPTDMQAQFVALATQCEGESVVEERLFENRFMHVSELQRMGAHINLKGNVATIKGKSALFGADVMATDLRASSALIVAGLVATGKTRVHRIYHLDRGYENIEGKLRKLGVGIQRERE